MAVPGHDLLAYCIITNSNYELDGFQCVTVKLPSQTMIIVPTDRDGRFIGTIFPGVSFSFLSSEIKVTLPVQKSSAKIYILSTKPEYLHYHFIFKLLI